MSEFEARLAYEAITGRVTDNTWYRVKRLLKKHRLEVTVSNAQFFAELRQSIPRSAIGVDGLLDCYRQVEEILAKANRTFEGREVLMMLASYGIKPHQTTISRWFQPLGGYRRHRKYSVEQLKSIFVHAFLYKAHYSTKLPKEACCG